MLSTVANFRRLPRDVRFTTGMWGLQAFGYFGIFGVLFNIYLLRLGYGPETIGLMVGAGQLAWGIAAIPAGKIGKRFGNRDPALWGIAIIAITTVLLLFSEYIPASWQTAWISGWWIISWLGVSLQSVNSTPFVMSVCRPEERSNAFTVQMVAQGIGALSGSLVAGVLPVYIAKYTGFGLESATIYWLTLWLAPLFYFAAFWAFSHTKQQPPITIVATGKHVAKPPTFLIVFVTLLVLFQTLGEGVVRSFFNVYLDTGLEVSIAQIGLVMGLAQALPILATLAAPWLIARWGRAGTIIATGSMVSLFLLYIALFQTFFVAASGYIGFMLILPTANVARTLFGQEIVAPEWRTVSSTANTIGISLGWASASALGGFVIAAYGFRALFLFGALMCLTSALLVVAFVRMGTHAKLQTHFPRLRKIDSGLTHNS